MKLDQFQNKEHISINAEVAHLKIKRAAFDKELTHMVSHIENIHDKYENQFNKKPHLPSDVFPDSLEYEIYQQQVAKFKTRRDKLQSIINQLDRKIIQVANQDMFDAQKAEYLKSGIPNRIQNTARISTGPHTLTNNPYYDPSAVVRFEGHPWQFTQWSPKVIKQYTIISNYLKTKHLSGFTQMFACETLRITKILLISNDNNIFWRVNFNPVDNTILNNWIKINGTMYDTPKFLKTIK